MERKIIVLIILQEKEGVYLGKKKLLCIVYLLCVQYLLDTGI